MNTSHRRLDPDRRAHLLHQLQRHGDRPKSGTTYISDLDDPSTDLWSLGTIDRATGQETIIGPQYDPTFGEYDTDIHALVDVDGTLYGFSYTRGLGVMNTSNGEFTPLLTYDSMPEPIENATIDPTTGTVYGIGEFSADIYTINVDTATGDLRRHLGNRGFFDLMGLAYSGGSLYSLGYTGGSSPPTLSDQSHDGRRNVYRRQRAGIRARRHDRTAADVPAGPWRRSATYSFALNQGESATIASQSLNGKNVQFTLLDDEGDVLGLSVARRRQLHGRPEQLRGPERRYLLRCKSPAIPGVQFNLVVTRGADFTTQPNTTPGDRPGHHRDPAVGR